MPNNLRRVPQKTPSPQRISPISPRELEVARLAVLENSAIAADLSISEYTVKAHLASVRRKFPHLENKAAIAVWAFQQTKGAA